MARLALIVKAKRQPRYRTRQKNRCQRCGRSRAYMRIFGLCRICFRELAVVGQLPGVKKSSW
ncbi:MAG: type Z 30S ribosomal protein S14 [Dehalococcoidia bacterium]